MRSPQEQADFLEHGRFEAGPNPISYLFDIVVGFCALVLVFVLSLSTGGFMFIAPWIIWSAMALFLAGF